MAQSGFALFFLAVLVGCTFAVAAWIRAHWEKIVVAVRGEVPEPQTLSYRAEQRRPMDVPYVAQRMLPQAAESAGEVPAIGFAWSGRRHRPTGHQLAFGF